MRHIEEHRQNQCPDFTQQPMRSFAQSVKNAKANGEVMCTSSPEALNRFLLNLVSRQDASTQNVIR